MKKTRFTETQIVSILKSADAGKKVKDLCRKHGVSDATYLQLEIEVRQSGGFGREADEATGSRERQAQNEVLNLYLFRNLGEVREITSRWLIEYNELRPHDARVGCHRVFMLPRVPRTLL